MVLFKRKPVAYVPKPPVHDDQEVWIIPQTSEIFTIYEEFLARMDFYKQKKFICEITGHSGFDFFDALRNETEASNDVDDAFPEALREPILRKVQFSQISRIDSLVDHIFEEFKHDFYPGETVTVILDTQERLNGVVREKTRFPELIRSDGTLERKAFARYFVSLTNRPDEEALVDEDHIQRDRKAFTKQMLRSFLKNSVHRDAWAGAPWLVKLKLATEYRIPTDIPPHLRHDAQIAQRKANLSMKKGEYDGTILNFFPPAGRLPELKPKGHKRDGIRSKEGQFLEYQRAIVNGNPSFAFAKMPDVIQFISQHPNVPIIAAKATPKPPPPPAIKYPIEDLEIPPSREKHRPPLKFLCVDIPSPIKPFETIGSGILMESVGSLLETWDTLNVYCEVFDLDSFTFDDYAQALQFTSDEVQCELLDEIHCAVLKTLVNDEKDLNGQVQISLPFAPQEESEEDDAARDNSILPPPEPDIKPRTTRSSLAKTEAAELKAQAILDAKLHRAAEIDQVVKGYDWRFRLRKRDFKDGRWVVIVVGLLNLLLRVPRLQIGCEEVLKKLAPTNMPATEETAISQYGRLDFNLRVKVLQIICMLSLETHHIRDYMEECTLNMTRLRKEKIDAQRAKKIYMEELKKLAEERKALQPEETSPVPELAELEDLKMDDPDEDEDVVMEDKEDEKDEDVVIEDSEEGQQQVTRRTLRGGTDRILERKRKMEAERERKEKAEAEKAKKPTKQERQLEKVLKKIEEVKEKIRECEEETVTLDNDLRENDCPRTRVLGKDRFWNRYYWLERNAMPYAGVPDSSTAHAGYANGCIWVQGPDDLERGGFIELSPSENAQYQRAFQMTVPERKMIEEGRTHCFTAGQWGYYDDPEQVDQLLAWLDVRGTREIKLRKDLAAQRDKICLYMEKRKEYLAGGDEKKSDSEEPTVRLSTRTKKYVETSGQRCLAWRNTTALKKLGHIHSNPPPRKAARNTKKVVIIEDEGRQTRSTNKLGKPLARQGNRYDF